MRPSAGEQTKASGRYRAELDALSSSGRVAAVHDLGVLEAPQGDSLASISRLAKELLGVPVSVVSILTESRSFSVADGRDDAGSEHPEYPLSHSFCKSVVASGQALVVEDARTDQALADHLAIRDYGVVAYAGFPLKLGSGEVVGAFCAVDLQPRRWSPQQLTILRDLAQIVVELLEHRRHSTARGLRDSVTGLPNAALFTEQVGELLAQATQAERVSVVAVNLAEFRTLNEAHGSAAADAVLAETGLRLEQVAHARRQPGRVCRLSADTFLVASTLKYTEPRGRLEEQLLQAIVTRPFSVLGTPHTVGARVATVTGLPGTSAPELIAAADQAIRQTRVLDGSPAQPTRGGSARRRLLLRHALDGALERGELSVDYQAIWNLDTQRITGLEALLRWNHPDLGTIEPAEFVPIAQSSGAVVPIGEWVLETTLAELAAWRAISPDLDLTIAVNIAPEQLLIEAFPVHVADALERAGVPPRALTLEITEQSLGGGPAQIARSAAALRDLGCRLSLDDFGTSLSTLSQLSSASVDEFKIDRAIVAEADSRQAFVAGLTAMAKALGLRVVAEGIETVEQRDSLIAAGCSHAQGFLLSEVMPARVVDLALSRAKFADWA